MAITTTVLTVQVSGRPGFESFAACLLSLCFPVTLHCCYQITPEKRAKKKRLASISTELANVNVTQGAVTEIGDVDC